MVRSLAQPLLTLLHAEENKALPGVRQRRVLGRRHDGGRAAAGLLVAGVFEDSPAEQKGIRPGDLITAVNGKSIAGKSSDVATARIKGKPGTYVRITVRRGAAKPPAGARAAPIRVPRGRRPATRGRAAGRRAGARPPSPAAPTGELIARVERLERRGAEGFVLDLRANGGGLLDEAVLVSSAVRTGRRDRLDQRAQAPEAV